MRRALVEDFAAVPGLRVVTTRDQRIPAEPGPWSTLSVGPGDELDTFRRLASEADYTAIVAPESDGVLRDRAAILEQMDRPSLGSSPAAIDLAGDKWLLAARLQERGIPTPPCRLIQAGSSLPVDAEYPAVLKPVDGAGSVDTYLIPSPETYPEEARRITNAVLQPFLPGIPMSAAFLVLDDGRKVLVGLACQRIEREGSRFVYRGGRVLADQGDISLESLLRTLDAVPGLRGWVGIDFLWDPESLRIAIIEVNPRLTTSYVGLRRLAAAGELAKAWYTSLASPAEFDEGSWSRIRSNSNSPSFLPDGSIDGEVFAA